MFTTLFARRPARRQATTRRSLNRKLRLEGLETRALMSGTTTDGVARIINGTTTTAYPSVGLIGDNTGSFCSGTLIAPNVALTAAHCAEGVGSTSGRFTVGGATYGTSRVVPHPNYNGNAIGGDSANDIALFVLNQNVSGVTPSSIYRQTPVVGQMLTLVGFGGGGTGTTGSDGSFGTKRVGTTPIDGVTPTLITWRFDNNTESNTAPGDSGGPAFVTVGGVDYVAGVTSGGSLASAAIGDNSFDTRVDTYASWIDSITGGGGGGGGGGTTDDHVNTPGTTATPITLSSGAGSATGVFEVAGDRDVFKFTVSAAGTAVISQTAITSGLDSYVRIYNSAGTLVGQNDDFGNTLNSQVSLSLQAGTYYVQAGTYNDAGTGQYRVNVQVTTTTADDHGDTLATATTLTLDSAGNGTASGIIGSSRDLDMFRFTAKVSGDMVIQLRKTSGGLDTLLNVYNSSGKRLATNDDFNGTTDSQLTVRVTAGQTYYVRASGYGGSTGGYSLSLTMGTPRAAKSGQGVSRVNGNAAVGNSTSAQPTTPPRVAMIAPARRVVTRSVDAVFSQDNDWRWA